MSSEMDKIRNQNPEDLTAEDQNSPEGETAVAGQVSLEETIDKLRQEKEELWDRLLRKHAELENYRKRVEKEKGELYHQGIMALSRELLDVLDACERALASFADVGAEQALESYRSGVELIYKQLQSVLSKFGVTPIKVQGAKFDPYYHEAVTRVESAEHEENQIIEELRRGYMYYDRLLRPAQVKVAVKPVPSKEEK